MFIWAALYAGSLALLLSTTGLEGSIDALRGVPEFRGTVLELVALLSIYSVFGAVGATYVGARWQVLMLLIGPGLMAALFTAALVAALISTPVLPYEVLPREQVIAVAAIKSGIAWLLAVLAVRLVRLR